jgi:hypothetical protein
MLAEYRNLGLPWCYLPRHRGSTVSTTKDSKAQRGPSIAPGDCLNLYRAREVVGEPRISGRSKCLLQEVREVGVSHDPCLLFVAADGGQQWILTFMHL